MEDKKYSDMTNPEVEVAKHSCCWNIGCIYIKWLFREPQFVFKIFVIIVCISAVLCQVAQGMIKLQSNSEASYILVKLNQSLYYPSLTICQHPPVLKQNLVEINLQANDRFIESISLNEMPDATTSYATNSLIFGYCETITPKMSVDRVGKFFGYDVKLKHINNTPTYQSNDDRKLSGWHIFIHENTQQFGEYFAFDGHSEHVFLNKDRHVDVKLRALKYENQGNCDTAEAVHECHRSCIQPQLFGAAGCMNKSESEKTFNEMNLNKTCIHSCKCPQICKAIVYETFVEGVTSFDANSTTDIGRVLMYYTSKTFMQIQQKSIYDLFQVFGDISGITALFLGISILKFSDTIYKFVTLACCSKNNGLDEMSSVIISRKTSHA